MIISDEDVLRREVPRWKQRPPWGTAGNKTSMVQYWGKLFIGNLRRNISSCSDFARAGVQLTLRRSRRNLNKTNQIKLLVSQWPATPAGWAIKERGKQPRGNVGKHVSGWHGQKVWV